MGISVRINSQIRMETKMQKVTWKPNKFNPLRSVGCFGNVVTVLTIVLSIGLTVILVEWNDSNSDMERMKYAWYAFFICLPLFFTSLIGLICGIYGLVKKLPRKNSITIVVVNIIVFLFIFLGYVLNLP